jgi:hypothetical protein
MSLQRASEAQRLVFLFVVRKNPMAYTYIRMSRRLDHDMIVLHLGALHTRLEPLACIVRLGAAHDLFFGFSPRLGMRCSAREAQCATLFRVLMCLVSNAQFLV